MEHEARIPTQRRPTNDGGFMLLGLIVVIFIILLTLSVAAPIVARSLRRDRELEAVHRGNQYVRAIQMYYKKFGRYPGSLDQLEKSNNIRFLRQKYPDPITGKNDWRIIPVGQNKTTVKWFFGQSLTGLQTAGVGSIAGNLSTGIGGASMTSASSPTSAAGTAGSTAGGLSLGGPSGLTGIGAPAGTAAGTAATPGTPGASSPTDPSATAGSSTTPGGLTPSSGQSGVPFMGVGLEAPGDSILVLNEQTTYATWEFLYDPRLDIMKAKALALNGGGIGSTPASSLGQTPSPTTPTPTGGPGASPTGATSPTGTAPPPTAPGAALPPQP